MGEAVSGPIETEEEINRRHNEKMARRKAVRGGRVTEPAARYGTIRTW